MSLIMRSRGRGLFIQSCCYGRPYKSVTYAPFPLSYGLTGWPRANCSRYSLKKKKKEKHTQILLYTCTFTHICTLWPCQHAHKQSWSFLYQSFAQCWEWKRYARAGYRRTQAICDSSLGLFPLILCRHLLSSRTYTHAQTVSGSWVSPLLPSMFTDRIVVGLSFQSKLLCLFFSRSYKQRTTRKMVHLTS